MSEAHPRKNQTSKAPKRWPFPACPRALKPRWALSDASIAAMCAELANPVARERQSALVISPDAETAEKLEYSVVTPMAREKSLSGMLTASFSYEICLWPDKKSKSTCYTVSQSPDVWGGHKKDEYPVWGFRRTVDEQCHDMCRSCSRLGGGDLWLQSTWQ